MRENSVGAKFTKQNWQKIDFKKKKLTKLQLSKLDKDDLKDYGVVSELELLRGVVFGKNGRVFKERPIQDYLEKQAWYKPKERFFKRCFNQNRTRKSRSDSSRRSRQSFDNSARRYASVGK